MSRLGLKLEDYSCLVGQARSIPRLSGRCAVFAKTDIIHRQQEGCPHRTSSWAFATPWCATTRR